MLDDDRGFIKVIKSVMLSEDAVAANAVGGGRVAGLGVENPDISNQGEPGGMTHRKRKREAFKTAKDRRLYKKLSAEGHVEFDLLSDAGQHRFNEGLGRNDGRLGHVDRPHPDGPVDTRPEIDTDSADRDRQAKKKSKWKPSKRSLKRGDGAIEIDPILPTRFESVLDESNPGRGLTLTQADFWIRQGMFGPKAVTFINYWRQVLVDPEKAIHNSTYRPYLARAFRDLLSMIDNDIQLKNRVKTILMKYKFRGDEDEIPEELARYAAWKEQSDFAEAYESTPIAVLQHQMASCANPNKRARLQAEIRRRTGKQLHRPGQLQVGGIR